MKTTLTAKILEGINEVMEGGAPMTAPVAKKVLSNVNMYIKRIYKKLQVHSATEAISKAIKNKVV